MNLLKNHSSSKLSNNVIGQDFLPLPVLVHRPARRYLGENARHEKYKKSQYFLSNNVIVTNFVRITLFS